MPKKAKYQVRNWSQYNKALVTRGSLDIWISEDLLSSQPSPDSAHGNQRYSDSLIECCLTLRQVYNLTLRATQGFVESLFRLLKLEITAPDYSTLSRRAAYLQINLRAKSSAKLHLLVDSTGVQVIGGTEWGYIKHKKQRKQLWRKLHIALDSDSLDIHAAVMSESQRADGNYLEPLIEQVNDPIACVIGDGAYDKKPCYRVAYELQFEPVFPPQYNAVVQRNKIKIDPALTKRDELISYLTGGKSYKNRMTRWKNKTNYHRRSLAETTMSRLKFLFGDKMKSKKISNQETDLRIRCAIINRINRLGMPDTCKVT